MAAAAVVSISMGVMKPVLAKLTTLMGDEYKKIKGLHKKVAFLQRELRDMDALLENMDSVDELSPQAKNWRKDIIEMSYNIEDCIDDFMQRIGEADNKVGMLRKAFKYMRTFKDRYYLANELEEIKARVMEASERRKRYMFDQSISVTAPVVVDPRLSAIYKDSASLVGMDAQKNELVTWAMDKEQQLNVMAIVGFGGLGKTTLVNEVYREVGGKFDCKAFVSISQKPDIIGLFNSLLSQLGLGTYSYACQLRDPIDKLRGHLQDKRYLIIVDDLWDNQAWKTIQCAFPQNNQCSRVMITTRDVNLARSCCSNHGCIYNMEPLSEKDSKKLFFGRIFGSEDACPSELKKASCEILKKCCGLPLAIITMASMFACQNPSTLKEQWEYIHNSLFNKFATNSDYEDMMYILDLSYRNLPRHLKACFLYLGSYPEDHKIDRVELVRRWVAEGFVSNCAGQDVWDVAESYFNQLVNRSMIQPIYDEFISSCRVHDMLLELILKKCKEDNFLSLVNDPQAVVDKAIIRRLTIVGLKDSKDDKMAITTVGKLTMIRSLTVLQESNWIPLFLEFKSVRVLCLHISHGRDVEIDLTVINQLSQLRYLKVDGGGQSIMLPCQIRGLQFLETFELSALYNRSTSLEFVDVPRLTHLEMAWNVRLPDGIGKVKSLRTLHGFNLSVDSLESIRGLGQLTALSNLHLNFPKGSAEFSKATWMEALSSSLDKLDNLKLLCMGPPNMYRPVALCADALSSFAPAIRNLERLYLGRGCTFSQVPRWIGHLHNLCILQIGVKQVLQEDIAIIGTRLAFLTELHLRIAGVPTERMVIGGSTGFPALEFFNFDCDGMSFLTFEAGAMPVLRELHLILIRDDWDKEAPGGLQHLLSLEKILASSAFYPTKRRRLKATDEDGKKVDFALIRSVFHEAADTLPMRPELIVNRGPQLRPVEEEDYESKD